MTAEQMQQLVNLIVENGLPPNWKEWGLLIALMFIGATASAFVGAYFAKRGEILAMKAKLQDVLNQTRLVTQVTATINSNIGRLDWVEQKKWEIKQKFYFEVLEQLHNLVLVFYEANDLLEDNVEAFQANDTTTIYNNVTKMDSCIKQFQELLGGITKIISVAAVIASREVVNALGAYLENANASKSVSPAELAGKDPTDHFLQKAKETSKLFEKISTIASEDLQIAIQKEPARTTGEGGKK